MDNVVLGLSVAVAVVLVLLLSCWKGDKPKKNTARSCASAVAASKIAAEKEAEVDLNKAPYGTAVLNNKGNNRYGELMDLEGYDDYSSVAAFMSLEPEVFDSHSTYSKDMGRSTAGASMMSECSHSSDVNPWVVRRPDYQGAYAQPGVRTEHSEYPDQMPVKPHYVL